MKTLAALALVGACAVGLQTRTPGAAAHDAVVETYKHLATAIIANGEAEESLVRGLLIEHFASARSHLGAAVGAPSGERASLLEEAATQITDVANEGDKAIQAIRQQLLKAGHHHHADADTDEDYIFVSSAEKKELLALARGVSQMARDASDDQIRDALHTLTALRDEVLAPE
jgi:hypothetical protein